VIITGNGSVVASGAGSAGTGAGYGGVGTKLNLIYIGGGGRIKLNLT
jgi:hypothetical protein